MTRTIQFNQEVLNKFSKALSKIETNFFYKLKYKIYTRLQFIVWDYCTLPDPGTKLLYDYLDGTVIEKLKAPWYIKLFAKLTGNHLYVVYATNGKYYKAYSHEKQNFGDIIPIDNELFFFETVPSKPFVI